MKYIYNKNLTETEETKPFLRTMKKLDTIQETLNICGGFQDDTLIDELEGKQCRLIQRLTAGYKHRFGITGKYTITELIDAGCLREFMNQEQISSIEEQLVELTSTN